MSNLCRLQWPHARPPLILGTACATAGGWHVYPEMAAAGLWTTAGDLARLGVEVLRALGGNACALGLKPETVAAMLCPQLPDQKAGQNFVGLGWFCQGEGEDFWFGHRGADEGFLAEFKVFPKRGKGAVVMINSFQGRLLPDEIFKAIGREYDWPAVVQRPTFVGDARRTSFMPALTATRMALRSW